MAQLIVKNGKCDLKFHAPVKNFKRIERFKYNNKGVEFWIDKNDSVYRAWFTEVLTWKTIEKGKKKFNVPDKISMTTDPKLSEIVRGVPFAIAVEKTKTYIDRL